MTLLMRDQENIEKGIQQGIERGIQQGIERGMEQMIVNMYKNGFSVEQIASTAYKSVKDIQAIISREELTLI